MASRLSLQTKLEELNENRYVYFQPPSNIQMNYPAIKYEIDRIDTKFADDSSYIRNKRYTITVISKNAKPEIIDELLNLPMCTFDRSYQSDNLNHFVFTIYW